MRSIFLSLIFTSVLAMDLQSEDANEKSQGALSGTSTKKTLDTEQVEGAHEVDSNVQDVGLSESSLVQPRPRATRVPTAAHGEDAEEAKDTVYFSDSEITRIHLGAAIQKRGLEDELDQLEDELEKLKQESICVVCMEDDANAKDSVWVLLSCGHAGHKKCFDKWFKERNRCPTCRKEEVNSDQILNTEQVEDVNEVDSNVQVVMNVPTDALPSVDLHSEDKDNVEQQSRGAPGEGTAIVPSGGDKGLFLLLKKRNWTRAQKHIEKFLSDGKNNLNLASANHEGQTPLAYICSIIDAVTPDALALIAMMLENQADPNLPNEQGMTPLMILCKRDMFDGMHLIFGALIRNGADVSLANAADDGRTVVDYARSTHGPEFANYVLQFFTRAPPLGPQPPTDVETQNNDMSKRHADVQDDDAGTRHTKENIAGAPQVLSDSPYTSKDSSKSSSRNLSTMTTPDMHTLQSDPGGLGKFTIDEHELEELEDAKLAREEARRARFITAGFRWKKALLKRGYSAWRDFSAMSADADSQQSSEVAQDTDTPEDSESASSSETDDRDDEDNREDAPLDASDEDRRERPPHRPTYLPLAAPSTPNGKSVTPSKSSAIRRTPPKPALVVQRSSEVSVTEAKSTLPVTQTYSHVHWPIGIPHSEDHSFKFDFVDRHDLHFDEAPTDDMIMSRVTSLLSFEEPGTQNSRSGARRTVKSTSKAQLSCTYETRFVPASWTREYVITQCKMNVDIFAYENDVDVGSYSFVLDSQSTTKVQDAMNMKLSNESNQEGSAFVQKSFEKNGFLQGKQLQGSRGFGAFTIRNGPQNGKPQPRPHADSLGYWVGVDWKFCVWVLPAVHLFMVLFTVSYLIFRHILNKRNTNVFKSQQRDALIANENKKRKGHGRGPDEMLGIVPMQRSLIAIVLLFCWIAVFIATAIILYCLQYQWIAPISKQGFPLSVSNDTGSQIYTNAIIIVMLVEFGCILLARYLSSLQQMTLLVTTDGGTASHALVEVRVPSPGSAAAVRVADAIANAADPEQLEDYIVAKKKRSRQKSKRSLAMVSENTRALAQPCVGSDQLANLTTSAERITRADPIGVSYEPFSPVSNSRWCNAPESVLADASQALHQETEVMSRILVNVSTVEVTVREGKQIVTKSITRFHHDGITYIWNEDIWSYERHDFEAEAVRLAHMRCQSGMSTVLARSRRSYIDCTTKDVSDMFRLCAAAGQILLRPYVLVTLVSCLMVVPRWDVFWVASALVFMGVIACYISTRLNVHNQDDSTRGIQVFRDDRLMWRPSTDLVPGDIIRLSNDMIMPVDAILINASGAVVQEDDITGDPTPQEKFPINDHSTKGIAVFPYNRIFAGSRVLYAHHKAVAVVTQVNACTQKGKMLQAQALLASGFTSVKKWLHRNVSFVIFIVVAIYASMWVLRTCYFAVQNFGGSNDISWDLQAVVVLVFMMQDFIYNELLWVYFDMGLILIPYYLCRFVSSHRLSALDIKCRSQESLAVAGNVNVMLLDKTGTITGTGMELHKIIPAGSTHFQEPLDPNNFHEKCTSDIELAMACCHRLVRAPDGSVQGNSLERSMFDASGWTLAGQERTGTGYVFPPAGSGNKPIEILHTICYDSSDGVSGVVAQHGEDVILFVRGSLTSLLPLCNGQFDRGNVDVSTNGMYGMAVAMRRLDASVLVKLKKVPRKMLIEDLNMFAYLLFKNEVKQDSADVITDLHTAGISTLMVTGDQIQTALNVSNQVGIIPVQTDEYVPTIIGDVHLLPPLPTKKEIGDQPGDFHDHVSNEISPKAEIKAQSNLSSFCETDAEGSVVSEQDDGGLVPHTVVWRNAHTNDVLDEEYVLSALAGKMNIVITGPAWCRLEQRQAKAEYSHLDHDLRLCQRVLSNLKVCAQMSPFDKSRLVQILRMEGNCVGFCGNAYNDGPALATADVGVALTCVEDVSKMSSFCTEIESISVVTDVLKHGQVCFSANMMILFFGLVQVILKTYGRLCLEGVRGVLHSPMILRSDNFLLVCIALLIFSIPFLPAGGLRRVQRLLSPRVLAWAFLQVVICFGSLVILNVVVIKESSVDTRDLYWVSQHGYTDLYDMRLQTPEAVVMCLFTLWMLCTVIICGYLTYRRSFVAARLVAFLCIGLVIKLFILLLLWSGPSTLTCWLGMQCDNEHAYMSTKSCLYGPQLLSLNRLLGDKFLMPRNTAESRCRFYQGQASVHLPEPLEISTVFGTFWKSECQAPHNCIATDVRWKGSIVFAVATVLSIISSVAMRCY